MSAFNNSEPAGGVKFLARRMLIEDSHPFSSEGPPQQRPGGASGTTTFDPQWQPDFSSSQTPLSPGFQNHPSQEHFPQSHASITPGLSGTDPEPDPTRDNALLDRLKASRLRSVPRNMSRTTNRPPRHTKGHTAGAVKRAGGKSMRPLSRAQDRARRGGPDLPEKARPPGMLETASEVSLEPSERSAALSDISAGESSDAMDMDSTTNEREVEVLLQPQTRPITLEQLVVEVRTIYEGVVQFEDKAIRVDEEHTQAAQVDPRTRKPMSQDNYMSYIALHKALLHEHHDLCLASQHPAASPSLRQLPARYSIPARMWRHGVHAPLEILRMRLPESREHMIAFILISFNHMTLFLETVPQFEATWLECVGDLGRYRLALAETDEEREIFSGIARDWYCRAIQLNPQISRLYHHTAILAPPFSLEQLSLYGRALTGLNPFVPTRKSITGLLRPILKNEQQAITQTPPHTLTFLRAHAFLALGGDGSREGFNRCLGEMQMGLLGKMISEAAQKGQDVKKFGVDVAVASTASILQYGASRTNGASASVLRLALGVSEHSTAEIETGMSEMLTTSNPTRALDSIDAVELGSARITINAACFMAFEMFSEALQMPVNEDYHPFLHVFFVMIWSFTNSTRAMQEVETAIPWGGIVDFLNTYANAASMTIDICAFDFPLNAGGRRKALPEDYVIQSLIIGRHYLPEGWTETNSLDLAEQGMEQKFMVAARIQRMLWAGHKIAQYQKWLLYDNRSRKFRTELGTKQVTYSAEGEDFVSLLSDASQIQ